MWDPWRLFRVLLDQTWTPPLAGTVSILSLTAAFVGLRTHWAYAVTCLYWGLVWAVVGAGAWVMNR